MKKDGPQREKKIKKLVMLFLKRDLHGPLWRVGTNDQLTQANATKRMYLKPPRAGSLIWHGEQLDRVNS